MRDLVRAAMRDGAIGFTSSQLELHVAHDGRGVPSNYAAPEELVALASVLGEFGRGAIEFIPRTFLDRLRRRRPRADPRDGARLGPAGGPQHADDDAARRPTAGRRSLEFADAAARRRPRGAPDVRRQPPGRALRARPTRSCSTRCRASATRSRLPSPARERALRDPAVREQMRKRARRPDRAVVRVRLAGAARRDGDADAEHERWLDRSVQEIADEHGDDPLDAFLDLSLDEDLEHAVRARDAAATRRAGPRPRRMMRNPSVMAGQLRRRRPPAVVLWRRLHDPTAHRVGARRPHARSGGRAAHDRSRPGPTASADRGVLAARRGRRRQRDRPRPARRRRRAALRARLPRRQRALRRRRRGLRRDDRQRRGAARGRHLDRRDPGGDPAARGAA